MKIGKIISVIFPQKCSACGRSIETGAVCGECLDKITVNRTLFCGKCGLRLADNKKICHKDFPYVLGAAASYDGAVKEMIRLMKFKFVKSAAGQIAELLVRYASRLNLNLAGFIVVPLPLSKRRMRERGFNQSELIAHGFAERLRLPLAFGLLVRQKHGRPQSDAKNVDERRENVRGAFSAAVPDAVRGKNVVLIDDVVTSGLTMLSAAAALKAAGARRVIALAAAKA